MSAIVDEADAVSPRFNRAFYEYAQCRGFLVDPAMVASPTQKPRVERQVPYVRGNFFAGESFVDRDDAQHRVEAWCRVTAGLRVHGTTCKRPAEVFAAEEAPALLPAPESPYAVPLYAQSKVHRDHCIEVGRALYSVPGNLIGQHVDVRADAELVRISHRGVVVKVHPRKPRGGSSIDAADLPEEKTAYAMRDVESLRHRGAAYGQAIGAYVDALLDHPLPWTRMRAVYRLLGLVKRYGAQAVEAACGTAMEAEAVDVGLISRMCERGLAEAPQPRLPGFSKLLKGRFARDASEFATRRSAR